MTAGTQDSVEVVANVINRNLKRIKLYFNIALLLPVKMKTITKKLN